MDRQNRLDGLGIEAEKERKDSRLPVVAVDDVIVVVAGEEGVDGHHEAGKALVVVAIAVHAIAIEAVHRREIEVDVVDPVVEDATALGAPVHLEVECVVKVGQDFLVLVADGLVERKDDGNRMSLVLEGLAEGIDEVGQSPGLDIGKGFACYQEDFHQTMSPWAM